MRIIIVNVSSYLPELPETLGLLLEPDRQKALKYKQPPDQLRSAIGSLLIRKYVGEGQLELGPYKKPFIQGKPSFNLSHSHDYVAFVVASEEVGIDVEPSSRCEMKYINGAFTEEERSLVHDPMSFAEAWTRKEAVSKCLGQGLEKPSLVGVSNWDGNTCLYKGETYCLKQWKQGDYVFCVAKKTPQGFVEPEFKNLEDLR